MFLYLGDHLRTSGFRVQEHSGRIAEVEIEVTTLGALLCTVRHVVISHDMIRVCGEGGVLVRVAQEFIRKWFEMDNFRVLRCIHCNPILAKLSIARLAEVD